MNEKELTPRLGRWRLVLGQAAEKNLEGMQGADGESLMSMDENLMDRALSALYNDTEDSGEQEKQGGLGSSYPNLALWLQDIRQAFPNDMVSVLQKDAIEKKGLTQLLLEPEALSSVKPDINMVSTLLALKEHIPMRSKEQARALVQALVNQLMAQMENDMRRSVTGALNRRRHSPIRKLPNLDWKRTIRKNLQNYDSKAKKLNADKFYFFENQRAAKNWRIILDLDQSGSMAGSIIYASIMASIFASIPAVDTRVVAFDDKVVDLTETAGNDPVDILFGIQLGGGTDINKSVSYCSQFVETPKKTLFILISDLYEGGVEAGLLSKLQDLKESGVVVLVLLAISDSGVPSYDERLGRKVANLGIPCFACSPSKLPELIGGAVKGADLMELMNNVKI